MKIRKKILEINYLAMICETLEFHCFIEYSAHVNTVSITLYDGKWSSKKDGIETEFKVLDDERSLEKADRVIYQLKSIVKKKGINYERLIHQERIEFDYTF